MQDNNSNENINNSSGFERRSPKYSKEDLDDYKDDDDNDSDDYDDNHDENDDDDDDDEGIDEEGAVEDSIEDTIESTKNVADAAKNVVEVGKKIVDAVKTVLDSSSITGIIGKIKSLIQFKGIGTLILFLIVIVAVLFIISFALDNSKSLNSESGESTRASYDVQDKSSQSKFNKRSAYRDQLKEIQDSVSSDMSNEDYKELRKKILDYNDQVTGYGDELMSFFDKNAGYQIVNQDATILLMMERLSYAYKYTDWEPEYDTGGEKEKKYKELKDLIDSEDAMFVEEKNKKFSEMELRKKKTELNDLEDAIDDLNLKVERYKELNNFYNERYKAYFFDSDRKSKVHPDGSAVQGEIISYYKDKYGIDTDEVKEELSYVHTIINRKRTYEKRMTGSISDIESFLRSPSFSSADIKACEESGKSLQEIEEQYKVRYELMHHEATLNLIRKDNILNSLLANQKGIDLIKKSYSYHMPIFEYVTYNNSIAKKTFFDYELYNKEKFDDKGNYKISSNFDDRLKKLLDIDIDFSKVESIAQDESTLDRYKAQLVNESRGGNADKIFIEELQELISELEDRLKLSGSSEDLNKKYQENYDTLMKKAVEQNDNDRLLDPANHRVFVDTTGNYYLNYAGEYVDEYEENAVVTETESSEYPRSEGVSYVTGGWEASSDVPSGYTSSVEAVVTATTSQTSMKPTKIRTILNSADYSYTKTESRNSDVNSKLEEARRGTSWQRRAVYELSADGSSSSGSFVGYDYQRLVVATVTSNGAIVGAPQADENNMEIEPESGVETEDTYGEKEMVIQSEETNSPGTIGAGLGVNFTAGSSKIIYYNQADYGSAMYGRSTIKAAGCGPSSLAMVVDSLSGQKIGVVGMCNWARENGYRVEGVGSKWELIPEGAKHFGLNVNSINRKDKKSVVAALQKGHPVIMICSAGDFTKNGHFICLVGIDAKGQVTVNDPGSRTRSARLWDINVIMKNASTKRENGADTFWEIWKE